MKQIVAPVVSNRDILPGVYLIWLESPQLALLAKPGQFVMVRCGENTLLPRPLSVHQCNSNSIALLFTVVGKGTNWLSQRHIGDEVELFGTLGNGFSIYPDSKNLLLVAGGIGIAPLYFLAQEAENKGCSVTLLYGTPCKEQCLELPSKIKVVTATEDGSVGKQGMVTGLLPDFIDWADQVFACGPMPMYHDMSRQRGKLLKTKPVQVSLEVVMGCGRGVCYGCTVKTKDGLKQVCQDGPVFDLDDILWGELNI